MQTNLDTDTEAPVRAYFEALNDRDIDRMTRLFSDDAVLMLSEAETVTGTEAVKATYQERFRTFEYARELHIDDVRTGGNLACLRCHSTGTFTMLAAGQTISALAREVFVLQREAGIWKIWCYMNNLAAPAR